MVDDDNYPWVLEVNMSPGIARRGDQQNKVAQNMCSGMLRLILSNAGEDVSKLPLIDEKYGKWESLINLNDKEHARDAFLDNRNAVSGCAIPPPTMRLIDANFTYRDKQLLLQRWVKDLLC